MWSWDKDMPVIQKEGEGVDLENDWDDSSD
jgi:hypothetical protein